MKKIFKFAAIAACVTFLFSSCEDMELLKEHPKQADASTFISNYASAQAEVNAMYYHLRRDKVYGRYLCVLTEALSDYAYGRGNYATSYQTGLTAGGVGFVKDTWAVLYRSIRVGNDILRNLDGAKMSATEYKYITGEIRFLRALAYSELVKYWGAVPFFDENNMDDFNKPRTDADQIWQFVYDEADYASKSLPKKVEQIGRPTRYAASMLKGVASLYLERWADAQEAFEFVISSNRYSLVPVSVPDDFEKLFGASTNGNTEEVFAFKFIEDDGCQSKFFWMFVCNPNPIRPTGALGIWTKKDLPFIQNWDKADLRYKYDIYTGSSNGTLASLAGAGNGAICLKFRDTESTGEGSANDYPLYRYADCLLWAAEARCKALGAPDATALEYVNMIRRRAYGLKATSPQPSDYKLEDYSDTDKFMELVLKERGYELCFEGKRYSDLKRLGKLAEYAVKGGKVSSESEVQDAAWWWPIPSDEFNYNNALDPTVDQNPGY